MNSEEVPADEHAPGILVRSELLVVREHLEEFRQLVLALQHAVRDDRGMIGQRWYSTQDPLRFVVIEEYADEEAVLEHNPGARDIVARMVQIARFIQVQVHGPVGARLEAWVARNRHASAYRCMPGPTEPDPVTEDRADAPPLRAPELDASPAGRGQPAPIGPIAEELLHTDTPAAQGRPDHVDRSPDAGSDTSAN